MTGRPPFSAALCRGLIEADFDGSRPTGRNRGFPRLYAAASLKRRDKQPASAIDFGFPRLYAAASLKHPRPLRLGEVAPLVFRGFMPRPH